MMEPIVAASLIATTGYVVVGIIHSIWPPNALVRARLSEWASIFSYEGARHDTSVTFKGGSDNLPQPTRMQVGNLLRKVASDIEQSKEEPPHAT